MLESLATIIVCGLATYYANYYCNKQTKISVEQKQRIVKAVFLVVDVLLILMILYSFIIFVSGIMGLAGVHRWSFLLYDSDYNVMYNAGLLFESKLEPVWFIIQGILTILACMFILIKIQKIRKKLFRKSDVKIDNEQTVS